VTHQAKAIVEQRACEGIAGLAVIETSMGAPPQIGITDPVERE
jgi:hypothetical protein